MKLWHRIRNSQKLNIFRDLQVGIQSKLFPPPPKGTFPPLRLTTRKPPYGLLAKGGELSVDSLLLAYEKGIFGFHDGKTINWWSCDPRMVLFPQKMYFNKRFRQQLRSDRFSVTFDTAFNQLVKSCAEREKTWLTDDRIDLCNQLHTLGHAHSIEVWNQEKQLVGGLFGVDLGRIFIGESSFHSEPSASKVAITYLACHLQHWNYLCFDIGGYQAYCEQLGFENIPRSEYLKLLKQGVDKDRKSGTWNVDESLNVSAWKPAEPGSQLLK
jgi:leucyl/phenylalanyl-tRNA--protein transferase